MIGFHFIYLKMIFTMSANSHLFFISFSFLVWCKCSYTQIFFIFCQNIFIDSRLFCDIFILHKFGDFTFQFTRVKKCVFKLIVKWSKLHSFHLFFIVWKCNLYPIYDILKILPKFVCIFVMLVFCHILFNISGRNPFKSCF